MLNDIRQYLLQQGVKNVDEAITLLGPALSTLGGQFQRGLRQAGQRMGRVIETPREAVERGVAGIFNAPAAPVRQSSSATYRLSAPAARPVPAATRPIVQASSRPAPAVMGIFDPGTAAVRGSRPAASVAPSAPPAAPPSAPGFTPLEGRQLDMFSGFNRLINRAGAQSAEGAAIGGKTFDPYAALPEGASTQALRDYFERTAGSLPADVTPELLLRQSVRQGVNPAPNLADELYSSAIPQGTGFFSGPVNFGTYQLRNLMANKMVDLGDLVKANPKLAAAIAGGTGLTAGSIAALTSGSSDPSAPTAPAETPMGPTTESIDAGGLINDPEASQNRIENSARQLAEQLDPSLAATLPAPQYTGAGGQTNIVTRGENEALTAAKQQYAKPGNKLANWYRQREEFANYPKYKEEIVSELTQRGVLDTPELQTWARSNPELAYELLKKATGSNLLPSQQTPQLKQQVMTAPAGSNPTNNTLGYASADAQFAVSGNPGAADIREFARPNINEQIVPMDPATIYALSGQVIR